jgi:hypothetical protein
VNNKSIFFSPEFHGALVENREMEHSQALYPIFQHYQHHENYEKEIQQTVVNKD